MQYNQIANFAWTLDSGSNDLSGNIYRGVAATGGIATAVSGVSDIVVGFQTNNPTAANQDVTLESNGIVLAVCGAAVTAGGEVSIMVDGKIENQNATNTTVGNALTSGVTGDYISIKLKNM